MKTVMVNLTTEHSTRHRVCDLQQIERMLAACSVDPMTLDEWVRGHQRFGASLQCRDLTTYIDLQRWNHGFQNPAETWGWIFIDLPSRVVVLDRDLFSELQGVVTAPTLDGRHVEIPYRFPPAWQVLFLSDHWREVLDRTRSNNTPKCPRDFLYTQAGDFFVDVLDTLLHNTEVDNGCYRAPDSWNWIHVTPQSSDSSPWVPLSDLFTELLGRWMHASPPGLQGQTVLHWLECHRAWIDQDLRERQNQWMLTGICPLPLSESDSTYHRSGFGTHETWMYVALLKDLMRFAAAEILFRPRSRKETWMQQVQDRCETWLAASPSFYPGSLATKEVIELERRRIPWTLSSNEILDHCRCDICESLAQQESPVFCQIDLESETELDQIRRSCRSTALADEESPTVPSCPWILVHRADETDGAALAIECLSRSRLLLRSIRRGHPPLNLSRTDTWFNWVDQAPSKPLSRAECELILCELDQLENEYSGDSFNISWVRDAFDQALHFASGRDSTSRSTFTTPSSGLKTSR
jgi:hypothetical protein